MCKILNLRGLLKFYSRWIVKSSTETLCKSSRESAVCRSPQMLCWFYCVQSVFCFSVSGAQHSLTFCRPNAESALTFGVLFLCASVGRESRASLWHTSHDSLTPLTFLMGRHYALCCLSLRGIRLQSHHPAFILTALKHFSIFIPLFTRMFWTRCSIASLCSRVSVFPLWV